MKHKGIIFDMDGTLWDSAENVAASWNLAISELGLKREPITIMHSSTPTGMACSFKYLFRWLPMPLEAFNVLFPIASSP